MEERNKNTQIIDNNNHSGKPESFYKQNKKWIIRILAIGLGILGGFLYYYFIGCASGGCPITSNPYISMVWGGLIGYLFTDMMLPKEKMPTKQESFMDKVKEEDEK